MKQLIALFVAIFTVQINASCEATIIKGKHSALTLKEAKLGAWEDAKELCYPGQVEKDQLSCQEVINKFDKNAGKLKNCVQKVVCTLCDEALIRKLEAIDEA